MTDRQITPEFLREEWVKALESGEYLQGRGALVWEGLEGDRARYCCLGVACEVAIKYGVAAGVLSRFAATSRFSGGGYQIRGCTVPLNSTLPFPVMEAFGLDGSNPEVDGLPLGYWNDTKGLTFTEIAAKIRDHFGVKREEPADA